MSRCRRAAFTLVEMLVVVVIIAILAAILLPVIARARLKAQQTTCLSNQRQISMAILMSTQDGREIYPGETGKDDGGSAWLEEATRNGAKDKILNCPASPLSGSAASPEYGFNFYLYGVSVGEVRDATTVVMTADARGPLLMSRADLADDRHGKHILLSFADQHVETLPVKTPIILGDGEEGTLRGFGAASHQLLFPEAGGPIADNRKDIEGLVVVLTNETGAEITVPVAVKGGDTPPAKGLIPGEADLRVSKGMSKAFALFCRTDSTISDDDKRVETRYTFGDPAGKTVTLTVFKPKPVQGYLLD